MKIVDMRLHHPAHSVGPKEILTFAKENNNGDNFNLELTFEARRCSDLENKSVAIQCIRFFLI
jgi:hypothetical protein